MGAGDDVRTAAEAQAARLLAFTAAEQQFAAGLREAWPSPAVEQEVNEAFAAYAAILREPWASAELMRRAADAYAEYGRRVQAAFAGDRGTRVLGAFRVYVGSVVRACANLDPNALDPEDLGAIAAMLSWVSSVAIEVSRRSAEIGAETQS
jgi:hypothetical protein